MFNFPPYPPKDYVIREVPKLQRSSPQFTPDSDPRVTQTTLGLFCSPVEYQEGESPEKLEIRSLNPHILEKWTNDSRALWVDKPGKDDFFLHDIYKKYSFKTENYNPNERHMEKVFNRSYKYELVCLEERRLQKLRDKCEREETISETQFSTIKRKEHDERHPPMKVKGCKADPPFWWTETNEIRKEEKEEMLNEEMGVRGAVGQHPTGRWAQEPCLTAVVVDDPCRRKYEMQLVGMPFKNEACNFYYEHYPPPEIKLRPKKFI